MINYKLILKIIGALLFCEASLMLLPLIVTLFHVDDSRNSHDDFGFILGILLTLVAALLCRYYGQPENENLKRRESFLVVALTWIVFSLFGSIPFILCEHDEMGFTNAFFETMSGFTTTGASVINNIDKYQAGLILWRSMTQWIGGLGITIFYIAILPGLASGGSMKVFSAEATGPIRTKMHANLSTNSKLIISIYLVLTVACAIMFWWEGMTFFDAVNYSMSTTATGGFSTHNDTFTAYDTPAIDLTMAVFMFLSGANFTLMYTATIKRKPYKLFEDTEFHFYSIAIAVSTIALFLALLFSSNDYGVFTALRKAFFHAVSFMTTTGAFSADVYNEWPKATWLILILLTFIGGCSGSTSGGMKSIRAVMLLKMVRNELTKILHPKAILPVKINGKSISESRQASLIAFLVVYVMLIFFTFCILRIFDNDEFTTTNAFTIALSCATNVGPALTEHNSWIELTTCSKWALSFLMLMGRLEILGVLVIFTPSFWRDR